MQILLDVTATDIALGCSMPRACPVWLAMSRVVEGPDEYCVSRHGLFRMGDRPLSDIKMEGHVPCIVVKFTQNLHDWIIKYDHNQVVSPIQEWLEFPDEIVRPELREMVMA